MLARAKKRSLLDVCLNVLFGVWVAYFIATGSLLPEQLLPDRSPPSTAEVRPEPLPVEPVEPPVDESWLSPATSRLI